MNSARPDNKSAVPREHYLALFRALDADEVTRRTGAEFEGGGFVLDFIGQRLFVRFPEFELTALTEGCPGALLSGSAAILIMRYLIRGARAPWGGRFLSYRELPWGETYDRNFNGRCRARLARTFGENLEGFRRASRALGGSEANLGDASADLPLTGGITARLILHSGDEEFPPDAQILFSDNVSAAWDAEDLAVMGEVMISALKECENGRF